jgi:hypothetical protein
LHLKYQGEKNREGLHCCCGLVIERYCLATFRMHRIICNDLVVALSSIIYRVNLASGASFRWTQRILWAAEFSVGVAPCPLLLLSSY